MEAYINATGRFLPGASIGNDEIDDYLGIVGSVSPQLKMQILHSSGITSRHYALDTRQRSVYSNAAMSAAAVRSAVNRAGLDPTEIGLLAAATTMPDLIGPGHASMVHGELGYPPLEIVTTHGICCCGVMALKQAALQVSAGEKSHAVAVAGEFASRGFKHTRYRELATLAGNGTLPMETAFLRYMLSDGAGAVVISDRPKPEGTSLRIDWITLTSYANTEQPCMYFGAASNDCEQTWADYPDTATAAAVGALVARQKLSLLPHLVNVGIDEYQRLVAAGRFDPEKVTWLAAHYSSERMKTMLLGEFARRGIPARPEIWYSNLTRVGNLGSAAIYVILDEMLTEGLIEPGHTVLCMVPESGRFAVSFMHLTAVVG